jgi:hypothetical protein
MGSFLIIERIISTIGMVGDAWPMVSFSKGCNMLPEMVGVTPPKCLEKVVAFSRSRHSSSMILVPGTSMCPVGYTGSRI